MDKLLTKIDSNIGWIILNRPEALNAITLPMFESIRETLNTWETDPSVRYVVIQGAGDKAFSAGGDVRAATLAIKDGNSHGMESFFRKEYTINSHIRHYAKPFIALIDGIAMGGGLGVSILGSHRIVTEKARLAMPESAIGFFPDVGASTFLNWAPGSVGLFMALTGMHINAADALWTGLGTHYIPSSVLPQFKKDISEDVPLEKAIESYKQTPEEKGFLETHLEQINHHFNKPALIDIVKSLKRDHSPFASNILNILMTKSPTSLAVIFRLFKIVAPPLTFEERLKMDFRLTVHFFKGHDFVEGVRALLIDKDKTPRWKPARIKDVKDSDVDAYFAPLDERELEL